MLLTAEQTLGGEETQIEWFKKKSLNERESLISFIFFHSVFVSF